MKNIHPIVDYIKAFIYSFGLVLSAYFDTTITFIYALLISFFMNILAGFRADEVKVKLTRIIPPKLMLPNFQANKFKTALFELTLMFVIIYILKLLVELLHYADYSVYVTQMLMAVAVYFYVRNTTRNLRKVYNSKFFIFLDIVIGLKIKEVLPDVFEKAINEVEKEEREDKNRNRSGH